MNRLASRIDTVNLENGDPELQVRRVRNVFNNKHVCRDIPLDPYDIEGAIREAVVHKEPIPLVGFW